MATRKKTTKKTPRRAPRSRTTDVDAARLKAILDSTPDAIVTIDTHGVVTSVNAATTRMFGYDPEQMLGENVSMLMSPGHRDAHDGYLERYLRTHEPRIIGRAREVEARRHDGAPMWIKLWVTDMRSRGQDGFLGIIQDVSERRAAEQARERLLSAVLETADQLAESATEISAATTEQAAGAQQQAAAVAETMSSVEEVSRTAEQAAERARAVAEASRRSAELGEAGRQSVEESIVGMRDVKARTESIAQSILQLAEQAQAIGEIIATVNDMAEQTNLLALNAAIEAARAGEHGRGFSVVAAEVKVLAEQSKRATAQVRQILNQIQKATNSAVFSMEEGTKSVTRTMDVVSEAGHTIKSLEATGAEAARAGAQISASAGQQALGMGQVSHAMRNIGEVTHQNLKATQQTEKAVHGISQLADKLKGLLAEFGM
ncbi:MAG: PAS domain S-box protein [Myxococcales bacterium]|nr:PAS domain S-box protein [Myxococcales bacterium]MCB9648017.1 PAS domain S-box protein [Deltaproteobacteria bacterium]